MVDGDRGRLVRICRAEVPAILNLRLWPFFQGQSAAHKLKEQISITGQDSQEVISLEMGVDVGYFFAG